MIDHAKPKYIYGLVDPRDLSVRYIGATVNPKTRYGSHLTDKFGSKKKREWIAELKLKDLKPTLKVFEKVTSGAYDEAEAKWIQYFKHKGFTLTNSEFTHESNHLKYIKSIDWTESKESLLNEVVTLLKGNSVIPSSASQHIADSLAILHSLEALLQSLKNGSVKIAA